MRITDLQEAKRLRDRLKTDHTRLGQWRKIRDREMDDVLNALKAILPQRAQALYMPVQSQEPDDEVQSRKHVLAGNEADIEIVSRVRTAKILNLAQKYEDGITALHEALFPIRVQLDECDGFLADGITPLAIDYLGPGPELAGYADREALEQFAEKHLAGADETDDTEPQPAPDDDDMSPEACYLRAFIETKGDHEKAYEQCTRDAQIADGLRYRLRVVDAATWDAFMDVDGVNVGMEDGEIEIHPALRTLEDFGVKRVGNQWVLTQGGQAPADGDEQDPAFAPSPHAGGPSFGGVLTVGDDIQTVRYTQIRTREQIIIIADHPGGSDTLGEGLFYAYDIPFDDHTGYIVIEGDTKLRAGDKRCQPVVLGLLETHQRLNSLKSIALAMGIEEGTRDTYQAPGVAGVQPIDSTQEVKAQEITNSTVTAQVPELQRVPTTGLDLPKLIELTMGETERFKMHEAFTGIGQSDETGIHLAYVLAQYAMRLQPYQTKRAGAHKEVLEVITKTAIKTQASIFVPFAPKESRGLGEGIRVAEPREVTPEMCALPVDLLVKIGAESDETRYAARQMSQAAATFGTISMTQHMLNYGVKDPRAMEAEILEDNIVRDALGGAGRTGWMIPFVRSTVEEQLQALIQTLLPQPNAAPTTPPPGDGAPGPGDGSSPNPSALGPAEVAQPVQTAEGGTPVTAGKTGEAV